ncbi:biotin/lipoyl-binding protein, partial [Pseudomonas aeruginosa]
VRGRVTIISPQVSGYVTGVPVQDFAEVKTGQVLATIDDRIYRARVAQAQA